jgi:hypothetical protein
MEEVIEPLSGLPVAIELFTRKVKFASILRRLSELSCKIVMSSITGPMRLFATIRRFASEKKIVGFTSMALGGPTAFPSVLLPPGTVQSVLPDSRGDAENATVPQFVPCPTGERRHRATRSNSHCTRLKAISCAAYGDHTRARRDSVGMFAMRGGAQQRAEAVREKPTISYERPVIAWRECVSEN